MMTDWGIVLPMWAAIITFSVAIYVLAADMWGLMGGIAAVFIVSVGAVLNAYFELKESTSTGSDLS